MSTKVVYPIPAILSNQMLTNGYVQVPLGNQTPFDGRLTDVVMEDTTVVLQIKISWRQYIADNTLCAFGATNDEGKGTLWTYNSVISRFRCAKTDFSEHQLAHFERLELYWATLPEGKKKSLKNDCPWMTTGQRPCLFKLEGHRALEMSITGVTFDGKCSGMSTEEHTGALNSVVVTSLVSYPAAVPMATTAPAAPTAPTSYTVPAK
jgi:hypothetical protein